MSSTTFQKPKHSDITNFFGNFDDFGAWPATRQIDYIAYYLLALESEASVSAKSIAGVAAMLDLKPYKRTAQYLSESTTSKRARYVKVAGAGYRLERATFDAIANTVKNEPSKVAVSSQLTEIVSKIANSSESSFLNEAVNCYRVEAHRAAIIMVWTVAMHHLHEYIFTQKLSEFNTALAKNPDKKLKVVVDRDDFSDLTEVKFIELMRSAGIISNDVRKLLDEKLGIRNSAAHPSGIKFSGHKATEFALDLIENILLKY